MTRTLPFVLVSSVLLAAAIVAFACGGSSGDDGGDEGVTSGAILTATPPDTLPEPIIVGENISTGEGDTYIVKEGDSLAAIAEQFGITAEEIAAANGIDDPTQLFVGQELIIPSAPAPDDEPQPDDGEEAAEDGEPDTSIAPGEGGTHVIAEGDTAADIAANFGLTIEELAEANGTTIDGLRELTVGEELLIPTPTE